jgi:hypothetical protein
MCQGDFSNNNLGNFRGSAFGTSPLHAFLSSETEAPITAICRHIGVIPGNLLKAMAEKVETERWREIYHQPIRIVEPVFANIRAVKRLDRFTLREKIRVNI